MKRFNNILCVLDWREGCNATLRRAVSLAKSNQAALSVVTLASTRDRSDGVADVAARDTVTIQHALEEVVAPYRRDLELQTKVLEGIHFLEVIKEVLRNDHDLVIKAPESPGWLDRLLGSEDMHLLRKCPCPVWLIKCSDSDKFGRILAAVDVDERYPSNELASRRALNRQVLEMAASLAFAELAELHVVHAWEALGEGVLRGPFVNMSESEIAGYVNEIRREHARNLESLMVEVANWIGQSALDYLKPQTHLIKGWARKEIPAVADELDIDLIVMGTVARTGVSGLFMGNTAETILGQLNCSVIAVKPPEFKTPVEIDPAS